ncbi:uncharacterized protein LOC106173208 [Lingula anatina]|uniref:Uncharacterized protein LOC106173208 n=1 Tax=Lingula anatina TaxID=7574 RepID=A0A1S3JH36_LINAN|nr:uncharacterized protein LOC106173208 [Lingula anatina]XP_013409713.1 uncharacterized protein LOC106173208 [Lingula anatina]|eukprot:XP_013409712.1 uncharacterized protein LOC106173208 [Lingula anatina]
MVVSTRSVKVRLPSVILEAVAPARHRRKKRSKRRSLCARPKKNKKMHLSHTGYAGSINAYVPATLTDDFPLSLRPTERQRMKPWLVDQVESRSVPGLEWHDKAKTMVRIPWKHAAQNSWKEGSDACLFKRWAIHTGKHHDGKDHPSPKRWKANFRCALNSLPDVIEVPTMGKKKGSDAFKIYKLCRDKQEKQQLKRFYRGQSKYNVCEMTDAHVPPRGNVYARSFSDPSHSANHAQYKKYRGGNGKPAAYTKYLENSRHRSLSAPGSAVKEEESLGNTCRYSNGPLPDHDYTAPQGSNPATVMTFNTALNSGGQLYDTSARGAGTTYSMAVQPYVNLKREMSRGNDGLPPYQDNLRGAGNDDANGSSDTDSNLTDEQLVEMIDEMERTSSPGTTSPFEQPDSWRYTEGDGGKDYYVNSTVSANAPPSFPTTTVFHARVTTRTEVQMESNHLATPAFEVEIPAGDIDVNLSIGENILENSQYSRALPTTMANNCDDFVTLTSVQADVK